MECLAAETWLGGMTRKVAYVASTSVFALVGAVIGAVTGAVAGKMTEMGFFRGTIIGAGGGAHSFMDVLDSFCNGEYLSKTAIFAGLMDGILKIYHFQIYNFESWNFEIEHGSVANNEGMTWESVGKLPEFSVDSSKVNAYGDDSCIICFQGFEDGERARRLPICCHIFHSCCIDAWLIRHGTCPMCRINVA